MGIYCIQLHRVITDLCLLLYYSKAYQPPKEDSNDNYCDNDSQHTAYHLLYNDDARNKDNNHRNNAFQVIHDSLIFDFLAYNALKNSCGMRVSNSIRLCVIGWVKHNT